MFRETGRIATDVDDNKQVRFIWNLDAIGSGVQLSRMKD